jgi:RimJ/RimL family protein N-acetyltransferase
MTTLTTTRLLLRSWLATDLVPFAALNADRETMRFMPRCLEAGESAALAAAAQAELERRGFGLWALALRESAQFIGYVGLSVPSFTAHFTPCTEVSWRLQRDQWGHGYATEAARACLHFAFATLQVPEVVSFTVPDNLRSRRVMERLGMQRCAGEDFEHPRLPPGHPLRPHVLYRLARADFASGGDRSLPAGA